MLIGMTTGALLISSALCESVLAPNVRFLYLNHTNMICRIQTCDSESTVSSAGHMKAVPYLGRK